MHGACQSAPAARSLASTSAGNFCPCPLKCWWMVLSRNLWWIKWHDSHPLNAARDNCLCDTNVRRIWQLLGRYVLTFHWIIWNLIFMPSGLPPQIWDSFWHGTNNVNSILCYSTLTSVNLDVHSSWLLTSGSVSVLQGSHMPWLFVTWGSTCLLDARPKAFTACKCKLPAYDAFQVHIALTLRAINSICLSCPSLFFHETEGCNFLDWPAMPVLPLNPRDICLH